MMKVMTLPAPLSGVRRGQCHLPRDIPDKAGEFASNGNTDLILMEFSTHAQMAIAMCQPQLCFPGDITITLLCPSWRT